MPSSEELKEFLASWGPCAFLDFEFNRSQDPTPNLVCCSLQWSNSEGSLTPVQEWWLHNDTKAQEDLRNALEDLQAMGTTLVAYGAAAEARSIMALGLDPHKLQVVDLYAEWRQLTFNNTECEYGYYFTPTGFKRYSVPPSKDKQKNTKGSHGKVGMGLVDCVGQVYGEFIDSTHKKVMRDLIISDLPDYDKSQRAEIVAYCSSDIKYLPALFFSLTRRLKRATRGILSSEGIKDAQLRRGSYIVSIAKMESVGFPLDLRKIHALRKNYDLARDVILEDLVTNHYPFFIRERKRVRDLMGTWTDKYSQFVRFTKERGLYASWPRTIDEDTGNPTDRLSREDKVLSEYDGIPEIHAYRQARKLIDQLGWFREPDGLKVKRDGDFFDTVGCDGRQRTFLGPYGTQTGRNAPKASRFILAMSSWLRCLITPEPGWAICTIDWASQEFAIAAIMSKDKAMMAAYKSGDPYLYFAIRAGAVAHVDGEWWKTEKKRAKKEDYLPMPEEQEKFHRISGLRNLFKSTTLGLQYGMGADKLAVKLTVDTGRKVTVGEAKKLITLHKSVYPTYWRWLDQVSVYYEKKGVLKLWDGWCILGDNDNFLSVRNFPVQGTGSTIMREAIRLAHQRGLLIMCPLHDAIYSLYQSASQPDAPDILSQCMDEAVRTILGDALEIRQDRDIHAHGDLWIEEKGEKYYRMLGRYLEPMEDKKDQLAVLQQSIFAHPMAM
jgi:hypothetical protein